MTTPRVTHPSAEALHAFGLGKLDDGSTEQVRRHLDTCAECRTRVAGLSADSFLGRLRDARANPDGTPAPAGRLDAVGPGPSLLGPPPAVKPVVAAALPPELTTHPDYAIVGELGRGGMGVVYLARNKLMDRPEVFKVVNRALMERDGALDRFLQEMRAAARLSHPNIVTAYAAHRFGGLLVFAMEYVDGQDLAKVVKARGRLPAATACGCAHQAALGLQHAHEKGMVHRDIKPANLMLARIGRRPVVKVMDFGLAKVVSEQPADGGLTGEGKMLGTPDYMAPEQTVDAQAADIRADVYSLGCTLYHLLTGATPFAGATLYEKLHAHNHTRARPVSEVRPDVPAALAAVVAKMMAKAPADRYATPAEVARALAPFAKAMTVPAASVPPATEAITVPVTHIPDTVLPPAVAPAPTAAEPPAGPGRRRSPRRTGVAAVGAGLLFLMVGLWAAGAFRVRTPHGTLVVEGVPADAEVLVDGAAVTVTRDGDRATVTAVKDGPHRLRVVKNGVELHASDLTVTVGGAPVRVRVEPRIVGGGAAPPATAPGDPMRDLPPAGAPPGRWVQLLPQVELARHKVSGVWKRQGNGLVVEGGKPWSRVSIPVIPAGSYELKVQLTRTDGGAEINLMFPVGTAAGMVSVGRGEWLGFQGIDGTDWGSPADRPFENNRAHEVHVQVDVYGERAEMKLAVDGRPVKQWEGHLNSLAPREVWRIPGNCLGLGAHGDTVVFHAVELRMVKGETKRFEEFRPVAMTAAATWVDLLALVRLPDHRVVGPWQRDGEELRVQGGEFSRVILPVIPEGSYEFRTSFTRLDEVGETAVLLPVGNTAVLLEFNERDARFDEVREQAAMTARKPERPDFAPRGKKNQLHVAVEVRAPRARMNVVLNGKVQFGWEGPLDALTPRDDWLLHPASLGLGAHGNTAVFHSAEVKVVSGSLKKLVKGNTGK